MKRILPPVSGVGKLCGEQRYRPGEAYRPSRYCVCEPCDVGTLACHTLTGELVLLEPGEPLIQEALVRRWFAVPEAFDERAQAEGVRRLAGMLRLNAGRKKGFTILTTTDCNARCFYCYERGMRRFTMDEDTARAVGAYIARAGAGREVMISWFGGEPLMNRSAMDIICGELRQGGISYHAILTTNGYFLDADTARRAAADWHIRSAQITLDGTEAVYNRTKAYVGGAGSAYRRVLDNIDSALDAGIAVVARLNMDAENADDLYGLLEALAGRFGGREGFSAYVVRLLDIAGPVHTFDTEREALEQYRRLRERARALGILKPPAMERGLKLNRCMADMDDAEAIYPDGTIGKCEHYDEAALIGSIYSQARDQALIDAWKEELRVPECDECPLFPMCVSLKRCDWTKRGCPEARRLGMLDQLRESMLRWYREGSE